MKRKRRANAVATQTATMMRDGSAPFEALVLDWSVLLRSTGEGVLSGNVGGEVDRDDGGGIDGGSQTMLSVKVWAMAPVL